MDWEIVRLIADGAGTVVIVWYFWELLRVAKGILAGSSYEEQRLLHDIVGLQQSLRELSSRFEKSEEVMQRIKSKE